MNIKIKELINEVKTDTSGKWVGIDNMEMFAELIVQECMANLHLHGYDDAMNQLKEHFGVE
jgi:hypothetical protein